MDFSLPWLTAFIFLLDGKFEVEAIPDASNRLQTILKCPWDIEEEIKSDVVIIVHRKLAISIGFWYLRWKIEAQV